ncbi:amino acid ABC transporter ATP-binding protein [Falsiroseomonas tokyonensis]|uniref:Amino acid ABC transporter ATP-binding protein n=1 Tax=Falsiroseomonas tokyonensis TaxID=430521 RepID=A0ABV7BRG8_9PROT|nr:amino acid ABC transporter ATP-binding protein [Falsiroseomonas tokyonensis]MBU8536712.1 amino acid ABC transporter ATP-binding protein [Falsiroseomonas tokyonensis]
MSTPILSVRALERRVGNTEILRRIDLDVMPGEAIGVIGPSGSGKSSLLRCIAGLDEVSGGAVMVEGRQTRPGDGAVGMVFQQFNLWPHLTARENVALALKLVRRMPAADAAAKADAALARVGLGALGGRKPAALSGGQQQRVAIARTLAMEPRVLLFDEPTAALDPELTTEVLDVIRDLAAAGTTMLVVSHEMGFVARLSTRVVFLDHGVVVQAAPPAELFSPRAEPRVRSFLQTYLDRVAWAREA